MYKGLTIEAILEQGKRNDQVLTHLPDAADIHRLPRQWIINVIYTLVGEPFANWVKDLIKSRNDHVAEQNELMLELDPEIAAAFRGSLNISSKYIVCYLRRYEHCA